MSVFRTFRKVFRDLVKLENFKSVPIDYGSSVGVKLSAPVVHWGSRTLFAPVTPFFKAISSYNYMQSFASVLRRDAVARLVGLKPQPLKTATLLAFLGITYQSGSGDKKPDLEDICAIFQSSFQEFLKTPDSTHNAADYPDTLDQYDIKERLGAPSSCAAVYSASHKGKECAVKVMYNYGIQSNNLMIRRGFMKEYAVLNTKSFNSGLELAKPVHGKKSLPPHPNIIKMHQIFVDQMPCLDDALDSYPVALPRRLNPAGLGRNKTLFLVMPKYSCSLRQFNTEMHHSEIRVRDSMLIFAQILEAIAHLNKHGIAHRDLKSDNILVDVCEDRPPSVVLSDFGCCLHEPDWGLQIPYETAEVDKGGNPALMAPEIINQTPGKGNLLDYTKSDVWAAGTLAYELFKADNPFTDGGLLSSSYTDDNIPDLARSTPRAICNLVKMMLMRNCEERVDAATAASAACLALFAPPSWFDGNKPNDSAVLRWLTESCLTALRDALSYDKSCSPDADIQTRLSFLSRTSVEEIQDCLALVASPG